MITRFYHCARLAILIVFLHIPAAWGGGVWLYEGGTPDLGTAGAGRAAMAADASTAGANPAGMTRLDRSQMLTAVQGIYIDSRFDTASSGFGGDAQWLPTADGSLAVMGNIGWQDWSEFGKQDLTLSSSTAASFTKDLEYDDTWHFALGTQYRFADPFRDPLKVTTTPTQFIS